MKNYRYKVWANPYGTFSWEIQEAGHSNRTVWHPYRVSEQYYYDEAEAIKACIAIIGAARAKESAPWVEA